MRNSKIVTEERKRITYTHIHTHTHTHTYTHTHTHTHKYTYTYTCIHIYISMCTCICLYPTCTGRGVDSSRTPNADIIAQGLQRLDRFSYFLSGHCSVGPQPHYSLVPHQPKGRKPLQGLGFARPCARALLRFCVVPERRRHD